LPHQTRGPRLVGVDDERELADGAHGSGQLRGGGALRNPSKNSRLPSAPSIGESIAPSSAAPGSWARAKARTRSSVAARTAGSRITPRPLSASALPASNCGLTRATRTPPGRRKGQTAGRTEVREMKE